MLSYNFSNLCGAAYRGGSILFTKDGNSIISPVDNRVNIYDLVNNRSFTLPCEARKNIRNIVLSPDNHLLFAIDVEGSAILINLVKGTIIHRMNFKSRIFDAKFSPCGKYFAITNDKKVEIWESPSLESGWQLAKIRSISGHMDTILSLDWSSNSRYIVTGSSDMTVRVFCIHAFDDYIPVSFVDHRSPVRAVFFSEDMLSIISISQEGVIISYEWNEGDCENPQENKGKVIGEAAQGKKQKLNIQKKQGKVPLSSASSAPQPLQDSGEVIPTVSRTLGPLDSIYTSPTASSSPVQDYINGYWSLQKKAYANQAKNQAWTKISKAAFCKKRNLLLLGCSNGTVNLYECPSLTSLHSLSTGNSELDACDITHDGEWIVVGSSQLNNLIVWEWQSETFILKQQGHHNGINCIAYSPAGSSLGKATDLQNKSFSAELHSTSQVFATGGQDGKVKLWSSSTGFCFVTFTDHTGPVNDVVFTPQGNAVLSASSDGSIRAFDLLRYKNFRTLVSPDGGEQFQAVAIDGSGEIVIGATSSSKIIVWALQTGKVLETLSGHTSPCTSLVFNPHPSSPGVFASSSWDETVRVWDIFGRADKGGAPEVFQHTSMVMDVAWDPRGNKRFATSVLAGQIVVWDSQSAVQVAEIDGLRDIRSGRTIQDKVPANNSRGLNRGEHVGKNPNLNQYFNSIAYLPTGQYLVCASHNSPRVCVFDVDASLLVRTVQLTHNLSLDGILVELNSKYLTEGGFAEQEIEMSDEEEEKDRVNARREKRMQEARRLPGVKEGELSDGRKKMQLHLNGVGVSVDGREWSVATSHGVYVYAVDVLGGNATKGYQTQLEQFSPVLITKNVSVGAIQEALEKGEFIRAFVLALALNDLPSLLRVYYAIPPHSVSLVVRDISHNLLPSLLNFIRVVIQPNNESSVHMELHLRWLCSILETHLTILMDRNWSQRQQMESEEEKETGSEKLTNALQKQSSNILDMRTLFLMLLRQVQTIQNTVGKLFDDNMNLVQFLLNAQEGTCVLDASEKKREEKRSRRQ